jgi:hypothetical protein
MRSQIKEVRPSKNDDGTFYGFIASLDGGKDYYFTTKDLLTDEPVSSGIDVEFAPFEEGGNRQARRVCVLENIEMQERENKKVIIKPVKSFIVVETVDDLTSKIIAQMESLNSITDSGLFEDTVFVLLRLLGIHTAYQYPRSTQAGEADGFFMIESFAVMYDCTLRTDFEERKQTQIRNYKNQLSQETQLTFKFRKADGGIGKKTVPLPGKKQVWLITRGRTRELEDFGGIKIKEIAITDLCRILERRIRDIAYDADRLATDLTLIGNA